MIREPWPRFRKRWYVWTRFYFDKHDLWIGCYWKYERHLYVRVPDLTVYFCLIPTLVLRIRVTRDAQMRDL